MNYYLSQGMKINEIFFSIQGETSSVGWPTVFVRTTACNLRCTYCDTKYSYYEGDEQNLGTILKKISSYEAKYVCLTGGEPLLQPEIFSLTSQLCDLGYHVSIETSGSRSIEKLDTRSKVILDIKTPDSGAKDSFLMENLKYISRSTEIKFVICSRDDFDWSIDFCKKNSLLEKCDVLMSPSFKCIENITLADLILKSGLNVRMQLQLHKYIWPPEQRGV